VGRYPRNNIAPFVQNDARLLIWGTGFPANMLFLLMRNQTKMIWMP
jgi:hypothetical protein